MSTIIRIAAIAGSLVLILAIGVAGFGVYTVRQSFPRRGYISQGVIHSVIDLHLFVWYTGR